MLMNSAYIQYYIEFSRQYNKIGEKIIIEMKRYIFICNNMIGYIGNLR